MRLRSLLTSVVMLVAAGALAGCAGRSHALDYVVHRNHDAQREDRPQRQATALDDRTNHPIFGENPPPLARTRVSARASASASASASVVAPGGDRDAGTGGAGDAGGAIAGSAGGLGSVQDAGTPQSEQVADCSVGLIGERCEIGVLAAETPLSAREVLPPEGRVISAPLPAPGDAQTIIPPLPEPSTR